MSTRNIKREETQQNKRKMKETRELPPGAAVEVDPPFSPEEHSLTPRKKKNSNNQRRFSDEQVRSLEQIFESETKLDPRKKVQVARELGLQPRQVAIWFQNKRARWKSKEIEKNYRALKANYDSLKARFDTTKKEKESLLVQLQELRDRVEKTREGSSGSKEFAVKGLEMGRKNRDAAGGFAAQPSILEEEFEHQGLIHSDDDKSANIAYLGQEEPQPLNVNADIHSSLVSSSKWCSFDSDGLFDQSSNNSHWWDSWS
ncbi:hypothetical protein Ancab_008998 [Ancistrocladus abbreviatus]